MSKRHVAVWIVCALVIGLIGPAAPPAAAAAGGARIQAGLLRKLDTGKVDRFVVEFAARADLDAAAETRGWSARGAAVYRSLKQTAARSQVRAKAVVRTTPGAEASSFFLTNVLVVTDGATSALARRLAALPGVKKVRAERRFPVVEPVERHAVLLEEGDPPPWGITKIGADDVWVDGILGSGVVVANVDTGVDFTHEALVNQYRGNLGGSFDHNYNWWDPTGVCGDEPCDNAQHGTHTMGTMVGGDGPGPFTPDVGVAPGAKWIAAKGCEDFFCTEESLLSAGEFVLAPTDLDGLNPDPSKRPDIVNNSWGGGPADEFYLEIVQAWRAAGIIPVFSAGNAGPQCETGGSPGDFLESFSVGATDVNDHIAEFSSRGPSPFGKVNPDVSAPGVDVISSVPGDGYDSFSGTSMAAPHTAGTLALLLSAEPGLLGNFEGATDAVRATAHDLLDDQCGGDEDGDPNNVFGDGRIDAQAAVSLVASGGTLAGDVTDAATSDPIGGATIEASAGGRTFGATTDDAGHFELFLAAGTYTVTASAFAYQSAFATGVSIETDLTTTQNFFLAALPQRDIVGTVTAEEDGTPIEGAQVKALGTPVAAAVTDADGHYTLTLPIGDHTIRVSAGGCTSNVETEVTLTLAGLTHDVGLSRKVDDFGHGCRPVGFDWVDAANTTALFGDQTVGRLPLPFSFPFYGDAFDAVYITDNGYVTFEAPEFGFPEPIPSGIPSQNTPNAAIYPLWQNLIIDAASSVRFETVGSAPDRAFVLEFEQMRVGPNFGGGDTNAEPLASRVDYEVKLWEDGRIDVVYGDNPAGPGDGRNASIGIENAAGTDALQFSLFDDLVSSNTAYRYEIVPSGVVGGTVTDGNDGLPIAGAVVTANPGGRTSTTDGDGVYSLRLRPGTYTLAFGAHHYVTHEEHGVAVTDGGTPTVDAALDAPIADVQPTELSETLDFGETTTPTVTISNTGSSDLTWEFREREGSRTPPTLPPVPLVYRNHAWGRMHVPATVKTVRPAALPPESLVTVIDDPDDDSEGSIEITQVRGGSDNAEMSVAIDFSAETPMDEPVGFVFFDTDQDEGTGFPPEEFFGLPEQDIGVDFFADLFAIHDSDPVVFIVSADFELVAEVPAVVEGQSVSFSVPLEALGNDDGTIDVASVIGSVGPEDWAPDAGHGTIQSFTDAPWVEATPSEGVLPAGETTDVDVTLGAPDLPPGEYTGQLFLLSDAPKQPAVIVDLSLTVGLPTDWGAASGAILDAHSGEPVGGASISVDATWQGGPLALSDVSSADGAWSVLGPPGTWPAEVTGDGFLPESVDVTIVADGTLEGQDVFVHADVPHGTLRPGTLRFTLLRGHQDDKVLRIGNVEGHQDLTFSVGEVVIPPPDEGGGEEEPPEPLSIPAGADPDATTSRSASHASPGHEGVASEGDVLSEWDTDMTLPWGVGYRSGPETVTLSDPVDFIDVDFTATGERLNEFETPWADTNGFPADMAFDPGRGILWQVNVGGDNAIYGLDPNNGEVLDVVSGPEWTATSQRGLAYDQATDTFYIGGWNDGILYHVAGPSWPTPGETLGSCVPDDPNISGLAWNPAFQLIWEATNSEFDDILLIDPDTCETQGGVPHPDPGFNGAGLELDAVGNLWTVSQGSGKAYLIESGLPTFSDVPWLDVTPTEGVVETGEQANLTVSVDSTGLAPGMHRALVGIVTDDPDNGVMIVPVQLLVTRYQRFVNVGGGPLSLGDGTHYVGDRRFQQGGLGWFGPVSSTRTTTHGIAGTAHPAVFKSQREGMTGYRFTVPDGRYRIELEFAELMGVGEFGRVMDISAEGQLRANNLDVAGQVGRWRALTTRFTVRVHDGVLTVRFAKAFGAPPILNGIRVTWLGS